VGGGVARRAPDGVGLAPLGHGLDVPAGAEGPARTGDHDAADAIVNLHVGQDARQGCLVGSAKAKELYYFSDRIDAQEAERLDLVNAVFAPEDLDAEVMRRARQLASGPSLAYRYMKENLNRAVLGELGDCMDVELTHHFYTCTTEDNREAAQAFVEKREPLFRGR
jgi:1,4-dihydroxy-2-naphthoyl-CoA synthase